MKQRSAMILGILATALVVGRVQPILAEDKPAAIDPKAKAVLVKAGEYLRGLKSFRVQIATAMKMESEGMKQEFSMNTDLAVQRPNKLAMVIKGGMMGSTVVCDGKNVFTYLPSAGKYTLKPAPAKLDELSQDVDMGGGRGFPVAPALIADKPDEAFLDGVTAGTYVGVEDLGGKKCDHVRFDQEQFSWDAWVQTGDKPLLCKIVPDLAAAFKKAMEASGKDAPPLMDMKADMSVTLDNWQLDTELPAELFAFTPPKDARKVDTFFEDGAMQGGDEEETHPLEGQPAPAFKLPALGGGEVALEDYKGKDVVILEFWATWCGPCRRTIPVLAEVAEAYKGRGVVLIGVNQGEDEKVIQPFLEKNNLKLKVVLDKDGKVGQSYDVQGIPQSVIVLKNGVVKKVHIGFVPDLKDRITEELEDILGAAAPEAAKPAPEAKPAAEAPKAPAAEAAKPAAPAAEPAKAP